MREYEADDIVGTLMTRCRREGLPATLVTRDKDFAQLIRDGDVYWDYSDNAHYRYHQIEERFGVAPERFADFLALMGDSVDNIKGVPGVGAEDRRGADEGIRLARRDLRQPRSRGGDPGARRRQTGRQTDRAPRGGLSSRAVSPKSPATCRSRSRTPSSRAARPTWRRSPSSSTATTSVRCCAGRPNAWRCCRCRTRHA